MWKKFLLDILFPQFCFGCGKEGSLICKDCLSTIGIAEYQFCPFCAVPKRVIGEGKCKIHQKMKLAGIFAATSYKNALVKKLITQFKYEPFLKNLSLPLAYLIIAHFLLSENKTIFKTPEKSLLVPVPLSCFKKRQRGFNQSEEIAKELSKFFKIPYQFNNLTKSKKTQPQIELKRKGRAENVKDSFKLKNPQLVQGKTIFLVDDVFTTGATMEEATRVLKEAGTKEVWGIAVAREPLE